MKSSAEQYRRPWRDNVQHLRFPRAFADEEVREFVVETSISAILRQIFYHGVHDFCSYPAEGLDEPPQVRQNHVAYLRVKV